mmetsp:Transcript_2648/g.3809  ORF Transcript_2648/g.3809 Transcript_2648/m.3809 type:complete len:365 (+) Transcript_2648:1066-2160(+)
MTETTNKTPQKDETNYRSPFKNPMKVPPINIVSKDTQNILPKDLVSEPSPKIAFSGRKREINNVDVPPNTIDSPIHYSHRDEEDTPVEPQTESSTASIPTIETGTHSISIEMQEGSLQLGRKKSISSLNMVSTSDTRDLDLDTILSGKSNFVRYYKVKNTIKNLSIFLYPLVLMIPEFISIITCSIYLIFENNSISCSVVPSFVMTLLILIMGVSSFFGIVFLVILPLYLSISRPLWTKSPSFYIILVIAQYIYILVRQGFFLALTLITFIDNCYINATPGYWVFYGSLSLSSILFILSPSTVVLLLLLSINRHQHQIRRTGTYRDSITFTGDTFSHQDIMASSFSSATGRHIPFANPNQNNHL